MRNRFTEGAVQFSRRFLSTPKTNLPTPIHAGYNQLWGGTVPMFDLWKRGVDPFNSLEKMAENKTSFAKPFDPLIILPSGHKEIRIIDNSTRDDQQSNLGAEMSDEHRQEIVKLSEVHYISGLIRSNFLTSLQTQPKDIVKAFLKEAKESGLDIVTCFSHDNNPKEHNVVLESSLENNLHFQAAYAFAVYPTDPTIYNPIAIVKFFKEMQARGAHSFYLKDPQGVLVPETAYIIASEVKSAFPEIPFTIHTHSQTGFAEMTYLKAAEGGANAIECSSAIPGGAGQPFTLTMIRALEEAGFDVGNPNKRALQNISDYGNKIRKQYTLGRVVRTPDISVEISGIAGGQRSIIEQELAQSNRTHLSTQIDERIIETRVNAGGGVQVTPFADWMFRETMRILLGGDPDKNFTQGFADVLTGRGGKMPEPVNKEMQIQAFKEAVIKEAKNILAANNIDKMLSEKFVNSGSFTVAIEKIVDSMQDFYEPIEREIRIDVLNNRIDELEIIQKEKPAILENMNRQIKAVDQKVSGKKIENVADRLAVLKEERKNLQEKTPATYTKEDYEKLLRGDKSIVEKELQETTQLISSAIFNFARKQMKEAKKEKISGANVTEQKKQHFSNTITKIREFSAIARETLCSTEEKAQLRLSQSTTFLTFPRAELLSPGLPKAREAIEKIEDEYVLGLTENPEECNRHAILYACFNNGNIPNMYKTFLLNRDNPAHWPKLYDGQDRSVKEKPKQVKGLPYYSTTPTLLKATGDIISYQGTSQDNNVLIGAKVSGGLISEAIECQEVIIHWETRIKNHTGSENIRTRLERKLSESEDKLSQVYKVAEERFRNFAEKNPDNNIANIYGMKKFVKSPAEVTEYMVDSFRQCVNSLAPKPIAEGKYATKISSEKNEKVSGAVISQ